jgi:Big-like domain-containing protein
MMSRITARAGVFAVVALAALTACSGSNNPPPTSGDTVTPVTVSSITVSAQPSLAKGTSAALTAKAIYSDNSVKDVTDEATWASSNAAIVAIIENRSTSAYDCKAKGLAIGAATVSASFEGKTGSAAVSVTPAVLIQGGLAITPSGEVSLHKGNTLPLALTGIFTDDSHQDVTAEATWSTGNGAVAAIAGGQLRATGVGSTTITAVFSGQQAEAAVTVGAPELTGIAIDQAPFQIVQDLTRDLSVTGHYGDGTTNIVTAQSLWSSDNEGVAEISASGLLTARAAGSANITAKVGAFEKSVTVTVVARTLKAIEIEAEHAPFAQLAQGLQAQLRAIAKYDSGHTADVTAQAAWTSQNSRATVSAGLVTASKEATGSAHIDATFGGFTAFLEFEVSDAVPMSVKIDPAGFTIPAGLEKPLSAEATFSDDGKDDVTSQVTWSTADAAICAVSNADGSHGLFKALKAGTCTVKAVIGGASGTATINVSNAALTKLTVTPLEPRRLPIGLSQQFKAEGTYSDDTTQDITKQVVWTSSNDAAASVSNKLEARGLASGIGIGPAFIKAEDPETHMGNSVLLWVDDAVMVKIDISCSRASLPKGLTAQCKAMGTYSLPAMPVQDVTEIVTWSSSDPEIASIRNSDPCGQVGWVKLGTAKITAKDPKTGIVSNEAGIATVDAVLQEIEVVQGWVFERVLHTTMSQVPPNYPVEFKAYGYYSDDPKKDVEITDAASWSVPAGSDCAISANFARGTRPAVSCVVTATKDGISHTATLKILDVVLNAIEVEPTPAKLANGTTRDFQAWGLYNIRDPLFSLGRILPYQFELSNLVTWSTHDVAGVGIADVSNAAGSQGQVLAKNLGRATVQAIEPLSLISGQADLQVTDAILKEISITPEVAEIHLGETQLFKVEATFTDGSKQEVTDSAACHLDSEESFAVDGGCAFVGRFEGTWTVTGNYRGQTDTAKFTVSAAQLLEIEVQLCDRSQVEGTRPVFSNCRQTNSAQVMVGQNTVFRAFGRFTDTGTLHGGFWEDITPFVAWDSSARDVAHVSNDLEDIGSATGLAVGGSTITAIDPARLIYDSLVLTVVPALP